jgi:hypothetical protein
MYKFRPLVSRPLPLCVAVLEKTRRWGGCRRAATPKPPKTEIWKSTGFVDIMISKILHDFPFGRSQPLKSADDQYIRILKNKLIELKKPEDRTL